MAKLPARLSKIMHAWREVSSNSSRSVGLLLAGDAGLVEQGQRYFSAGGAVPGTWVEPLAKLTDVWGPEGPSGLILLVLVEPSQEAEAVAALEKLKTEAVLAVCVESPQSERFERPRKGCIRLTFADNDRGWRRVFAACAELADDRVVGLARQYPVLRSAAAERVVYQTAGQNAVIGLVFFIPGADMPALTLNQLKMVLYLAGIYGDEIGIDRAPELASVVALGFGFRRVARRVASQVPGFGWVYKAIIAYTATVALGRAAIKYYESGAPASTSKVVTLVGSLKR